jgi:exopolyphosphatase/guanosine-5'-triphosphate,3'-diphosphate pyrophosphatase
MKLAALDLGSNSFHLLVAKLDGSGHFTKLGSHKEVLRLGSVVREHGQLTDAAFDAALSCVSRMATVAHDLGAEKLTAVATSALRDARNGRALLDACRDKLGVTVELVSGDEEARLAYLGARSALSLTTGRVLVADVGGGSVELACGEGQSCDTVQSLPLGFLRLAQAFPVVGTGGARRLARYVQNECERVAASTPCCSRAARRGRWASYWAAASPRPAPPKSCACAKGSHACRRANCSRLASRRLARPRSPLAQP